METDLKYRNRMLHHACELNPRLLSTGWFNAVSLANGAELDRLGRDAGFSRKDDPFGDAVRSAQEGRPEPAPAYAPDRFTGDDFDRDAAYRRAMGG